ncbi:hypothetical protein Tco_0698479 [Tanacetum coccineum]
MFYQKELNMRQRRWIELFSDFDSEIRYHPRKESVVADALSRKVRRPRLCKDINYGRGSCIEDGNGCRHFTRFSNLFALIYALCVAMSKELTTLASTHLENLAAPRRSLLSVGIWLLGISSCNHLTIFPMTFGTTKVPEISSSHQRGVYPIQVCTASKYPRDYSSRQPKFVVVESARLYVARWPKEFVPADSNLQSSHPFGSQPADPTPHEPRPAPVCSPPEPSEMP